MASREVGGHSAEKDAGLLSKYEVTRLGDQTGKHDECRFFVLDPQHDPIAQVALDAYAKEAARRGYRALARDLGAWRYDLNRRGLLVGTDHGDAHWGRDGASAADLLRGTRVTPPAEDQP